MKPLFTSAEATSVQGDFYARGESAWQHFMATNEAYTFTDVLAKLVAMTDARRSELKAMTTPKDSSTKP